MLAKMLPVGPEDQRRALAAFALFFVFMSSYYVFKPVRGALYLHYIGAENLPYAYLASMGVAFVTMAIYNRLFIALDARRLFNLVVSLLAGSALILWAMSALRLVTPELFSFVLFMWVSLYGALAATLFWSVANNNFDPETGAKVYGFIGAGGIAGAFTGGAATKLLLQSGWLETEDLLLVGIALLVVTLPMMQWVRGAPALSRDPVTPQNPVGADEPERDGLYWITRDRYVAAIAALVLTTTVTGTLLDLQYNRVVAETITDKADKAAFFGQLYAAVNAVGFCVQMIVTGAVHRRFGPRPGLLVLPVLAGAGAVVVLSPSLDTVTVVWVLSLAVTYSIHQASKELLYLPTPPAVRVGAKGYIDVFVFRLGDAGASTIALLWKRIASSTENLSYAVFALAPASVMLALSLGRWHRERLAAAKEDA